jgi:glycosyltransferase involved in cell wall biosynthesis
MKSIARRTRSDAHRRLGYLSGAPRVTTRDTSDAAGPRAHVLGVIEGFEHQGWTVARYIVGDGMPDVVARDGETMLRRSRAWTLMADVARLGLRYHHARRAWAGLNGNVDWVYERFALFQALGHPFARRGIPWILETNALLADEASKERQAVVLTDLARRLEREAYHACTVLVTVSEALADQVVSEMGVPREKIMVVPNGVDVQRFNPERVSAERLSEDFTIVFVGSLAPWQGLDTLWRAVAATASTVPAHVLVVGDGPQRGALEALASELGIAPRVRFVGRVAPDAVPALIAGADVCYSGHSAFRSPLKLYEYMAMGRPVIASAVPDARRAICDGENGYLFPPGDAAALSRALATAYAARDNLGRIGRVARAHAVAEHSWDARVAAICAHVEAVT